MLYGDKENGRKLSRQRQNQSDLLRGDILYLNDIVSRFHNPKPNGSNSFMVRCPCHNDSTQSLCISEDNGKILINCFAGCKPEDIIKAAGLSMRDLFQAPQQSYRPPKPEQVTYNYSDRLRKIRFYPKFDEKKCKWIKSFYWQYKDNNGVWQNSRGGINPPLYRQNILNNAAANATVYIVEGEKDADTMNSKINLPAVSAPDGASKDGGGKKWDKRFNALFKDLNVCIIPDNDEAGRNFASLVADELLPIAKSVKILDLCREWDISEKEDITDIYEREQPSKGKTIAQTVKFKIEAIKDCTTAYEKVIDMSHYIKLSDVESKNTEWLWYPYIPLGKITLMTADPGTGKTFLALYLAAQVSTGRPFYGEGNYTAGQKVVYQTAEDGIADTIKPRLEPMRPNFENIYIYNEESESLSLSSDRVEKIMQDLHPALMIFDPLQAYLGADVDMHRANEVRPVLGRIGHLAEKYNCAVVFIMHNSKMSQNSALHRALGSIDIPAVARSMLILGKDPENSSRKIICHEKSSLAPNGKSIEFEIDVSKGGVLFCGYSDLKADDILNMRSGVRNKASEKKDNVIDKLLELFGEKDYIKLNVSELCKELDCSQGTLYNARKELQLQYYSEGFGANKTSYWLMPDTDIEAFRQAHKADINSA